MTDDLLGALRDSLEATTPAPVEVKRGQTWRHKRDAGREVYVGTVETDPRYGAAHAHVTRNTSRRTQAIKLSTLRRDYRLHREAS